MALGKTVRIRLVGDDTMDFEADDVEVANESDVGLLNVRRNGERLAGFQTCSVVGWWWLN